MSDITGHPVVERVAENHDRKGQPVVETGQQLIPEHAQIIPFLGPIEGANPRRLSGGDQETRIPG